MRGALLLVVMLFTSTLGTGCVARDQRADRGAPVLIAEVDSPYVLFDRYAGATHAEELAPRPDWPAVETGTRLREAIFFKEHFIDRQSGTRHAFNTFYRRFTTRRAGVIVR